MFSSVIFNDSHRLCALFKPSLILWSRKPAFLSSICPASCPLHTIVCSFCLIWRVICHQCRLPQCLLRQNFSSSISMYFWHCARIWVFKTDRGCTFDVRKPYLEFRQTVDPDWNSNVNVACLPYSAGESIFSNISDRKDLWCKRSLDHVVIWRHTHSVKISVLIDQLTSLTDARDATKAALGALL